MRYVLLSTLPSAFKNWDDDPPSFTKDPAVSAPDDELNVRLVPLFGGRLPVAAVVNNTLHEVSDDSSATVTFVAVVAVVAVPVKLPENPAVDVVTPVIFTPA